MKYPTPDLSYLMPCMMIVLGILMNVLSHGSVLSGSIDCQEAERGCVQDQDCTAVYRVLEYCAAEEAVSPLGPDARGECLEAQSALQQYRPLQACKCQRGSRREELCLRVYWTVRFAVYDEYEVSPYEDLEVEFVRHIEMSRMASIMAASSLPLDGQNQCLKAAQDCGLYEKCGSLRSEYVVACTKRAPGSDGSCNRQKCHRALRRFLERVPEEYSFALLFCPCSDALCGERRRKTIVPSCSYEERDSKPNCLSLQGYCARDELCRSRLADFQHNCQPSSHSPSGCMRDSGAVCLKAYAGLIGTIMTPNYANNLSMDVSQWCTCEGSGNQWQDCLHIMNMFHRNVCLRNAISYLGGSSPRPVESTTLPPRHHASATPSPRIFQDKDKINVNVNILSERNSVEDSEEEEVEEESQEFNVIPLYSEKEKSSVGSGTRGGRRGAASHTAPMLPLLLLPAAMLGWWCPV
ncbi:GDNF family receptor alpha-4-like isoform 2-T2 [Salvelinus alpinus]|uniref:GDNF family receptor alpha-4-like isoform X2 n=1 Tax=Salvelinus alpinus TaxID=8036 RepID=UPI0039FD089C